MNNRNAMDVIFVNPPLTLEERYGDLSAAGSNFPSMGLLLLASVVRRMGLTTKIIDAPSLNLSYSQTMDRIFETPPVFLGITAVTPSVHHAAKLAGMVKERDNRIITITGGPHLTAVPEETMKRFPEFDIGVIGEGESTVTELFNKFKDLNIDRSLISKGQWGELSAELEKIPGLILRNNGSFKITDKRATIKDLDTLPFPAWDLLPGFPDAYKPAAFKYKKLPATYVLTSRGCPHKCIFCDTSVFSRQFRYFSAEYMIEMIMLLHNKYGIREISFEDDTFLTFKKRLIKICESLIREKLDISWSCNGRVHGVDREVLSLMKRAGCWQVSYGIESGDQGILDFADKHIKLEQVERAIALTAEAGILSKGFFILGFPFDTDETIERTITFAKRLKLNDISVSMMTPFPGSQMYEIGQKHGTINTDWQSMNLLETVFIPDGLTKEKLEYYNKKFLKEFYLRPRIMSGYLKRAMANPKTIVPLSRAFAGLIKKVFTKKMKSKTKRKILIMTQHFYPEVASTAQLMTDLAMDLVDKGMDVTVLAARPYYLTSQHKEISPKEEYLGIKIIRVFTTRFDLSNILGRIPNWLSFHIFGLIKSIVLARHDVVLTLTNPPYMALVGMVLQKLKGSKFIFGVQDIYPDVPEKLGLIKNKTIVKLLSSLTRWNYRKADRIISIGEFMREEIIRHGIRPEKIAVIHNWADSDELYPICKEENPFVEKLGLQGKFIVSYSGNFGIVHDFNPIKKAIRVLECEKDIVFLFIGDGTEKGELEKFVTDNDLKNVKFLPFQPRENILHSLNACDVSLVSIKRGMEGKLVPSKLYGSLAVGKPVIGICSQNSEVAVIIEENRCGLVDTDNDLSGKILRFYHDPHLRDEMGRNGRDAFMKKYDRAIATEKYYREIVGL